MDLKRTLLIITLIAVLMAIPVNADTEGFEDDTLESFVTEFNSGLTVTYDSQTANITGASSGSDYHFFKAEIADINVQYVAEADVILHSGTLGTGLVLMEGNITQTPALQGFNDLIFSVSGATTDDFAIYYHNQSDGDIYCWDVDAQSWVNIGFYGFTSSSCDGDIPLTAHESYTVKIQSNSTHTRGVIVLPNSTEVMSGWVDNAVFDPSPASYSIYVGEADNDTYHSNYEIDYLTFCEPDWQCDLWGDCSLNDSRTCIQEVDNNGCGLDYLGELSDFGTDACDYCTPNWYCSRHISRCPANHVKTCITVTDSNGCYLLTGLESDDFDGDYAPYATTCGYNSTYTTGDVKDQTVDTFAGAFKEVLFWTRTIVMFAMISFMVYGGIRVGLDKLGIFKIK